MERKILETKDGSRTLYVPALNEHYHSLYGALQESQHIFIEHGLRALALRDVRILEAGFGTGLNAWLTRMEAVRTNRKISYHTVEKYPLTEEEASLLRYPELSDPGNRPEDYESRSAFFCALHKAPWNKPVSLAPDFTLYKHLSDFREFTPVQPADLIYYDAFSPEAQPALWNRETLARFCEALAPGGILVTYCVKGVVKEALRSLGLTVERLPGPPGKRHILRAAKPAG